MNLKKSLAIGLSGLGILAGLQAQPINLPGAAGTAPTSVPPAMKAPPAPPAQTFSETQLLETIGWVMGKNSQLDTFDFTKDQLDSVIRGFTQAAGEKDEPPIAFDKIGPQVQEYVQKKQEAYTAKLKAKGSADADKFFADLKKNSKVSFTATGLGYEIIKPGTGPNAKPTDTVHANYTGTLIDGTVFDSTKPPAGQAGAAEPADIPLADVLPGWTEGLQKINKGGIIKLYIPAKLAYGDTGAQGIPPASTLIFEVEILDIKPTPGPGSLGPVLPGMGAK